MSTSPRGRTQLLSAFRRLRGPRPTKGLSTGDAVATAGDGWPRGCDPHRRTRTPTNSGGGPDLLASCHRRSLEVAAVLGIGSVAFPAISCGAYGWQTVDAAPVAVDAVRDFARSHPESGVDLVRFVLVTARRTRISRAVG
ncbi:MAG: macro domain-containing protein [Candidatus Nanopelagicales bacterium]